MNLTFLQLVAYLELNDTLDKVEQAKALWTATMGARGDEKVIKQQMMELTLLGGSSDERAEEPVSMAKPIKMRSRKSPSESANGKSAASDGRRQEAPGKPGEARQ